MPASPLSRYCATDRLHALRSSKFAHSARSTVRSTPHSAPDSRNINLLRSSWPLRLVPPPCFDRRWRPQAAPKGQRRARAGALAREAATKAMAEGGAQAVLEDAGSAANQKVRVAISAARR